MRLAITLCATLAGVFGLVVLSADSQSVGLRRGGGGIPPIVYVGPITGVSFGPVISTNGYPTHYTVGDTWFSTWGDDGKTYITNNDGCNWNVNCFYNYNALRVSVLGGWDANWWNGAAEIGGTNMTMATFDSYNGGGVSTDASSFKSSGLLCVQPPGAPNGYFYLATRRYKNDASGFQDTQIVKSHDHGVTWTPLPANPNQPYSGTGLPMWPGTTTMGGFVQYGQCYTGNGPDGSNTYIYAGMWDTSPPLSMPSMMLGRVAITDIDALDPTKWSFYQSGGTWGALSTAVPVLRVSDFTGTALPVGLCCTGGMQYLSRYQQYVLIGMQSNAGANATTVFAASHPWGPWSIVKQYAITGVSGYYPNWQNVIPASVVNGGQQVTIAESGDPSQGDASNPSVTYRLYFQNLTFTP